MAKYACTRWAFNLSTWTPTLPQLAVAISAVQLEERKRLQKFYFIDDFLSSLLGRLLMRKYISGCTGLDYHSVQFTRDARGKPQWFVKDTEAQQNMPKISFNISHQGDFVVLAGLMLLSKDNSDVQNFGIGVDVMKVEYTGGKPLKEFFRIMRNKFSESEWRYIQHENHNEQQQLKAFMRHWCLKEAYVKELGVGITIDLQKIVFHVDANTDLTIETQPITSTTLRSNDVQMHNWHFEEHLLQPQYCAAIAFRNCQPAKNKFEVLTIDDLLVPTIKANDTDVLDYCQQVLLKQRKC